MSSTLSFLRVRIVENGNPPFGVVVVQDINRGDFYYIHGDGGGLKILEGIAQGEGIAANHPEFRDAVAQITYSNLPQNNAAYREGMPGRSKSVR
ncbi:MAG: hypothetical protein AAB733_00270 [Patescibacteria group bacterium]